MSASHRFNWHRFFAGVDHGLPYAICPAPPRPPLSPRAVALLRELGAMAADLDWGRQ